MASFSLSNSLTERNKLTRSQYKQIRQLYLYMANMAGKRAEKLKQKTTYSSSVERAELQRLAELLQEEADKIGSRMEKVISDNISKVAASVVIDAKAFNSKIGLQLEEAYSWVPSSVVEMLVSGKIYRGKWSLSSAIWSDVRKTQKDITFIVAQGAALNKTAYEIAKDLEKYVDPSAKKPWDWGKVYPGTKKQVDYNSQRLARTLLNHSYQQSVAEVARKDPFVDGVRWISGHSSTSCELCEERDGKVYPANKIPLDHPNGKCSFSPVVSRSLSDISDELAAWANGEPNKKLDAWYSHMNR